MNRLKRRLLIAAIPVCAVAAGIWLSVGFEFHVGDHETGNFHTAFLKAAPTTTLVFHDPFQGGDAGRNPDHLSGEALGQFMDYCRYKMGLSDSDARQCFATYQASACKGGYLSRGIDCPADSEFVRSTSSRR